VNHGIVTHDPTRGSPLWQLAMEQQTWPHLCAPRAVESNDLHRTSSRRTIGAVASEAFLRALPPLRMDDGRRIHEEYGRYECALESDFASLCRDCVAVPKWGVVVPKESPDADATSLFSLLVELQPKTVEACIAGKKIKPTLHDAHVRFPWILLLGFCYEDPSVIFLSQHQPMCDRFANLVESAGGQINERW
jgi:hypothetical protein